MKKEIMYLFLICIVAIPLFWFGNLMNPSPGSSSGNGNPAIIIMAILLLLFLTMVYLLVKIINNYSLKSSVSIFVILIISVHLIVSFLYQRNSFLNHKEVLANAYEEQFGYVDWTHIDQITSFLSMHINAQYFNLNTYFMFITLAILISLILSFFPQIRRLQFVN